MPVASAEAPILAMLLPSSSAPINRSRMANRLETTLGLAVALLREPQHAGARGAGQRGLARREESGDQEAENDDGEGKPVQATSSIKRLGSSASLAFRKSRTGAGSTFGAITARPTASSRMKVSLPRLTFLSCAISAISASASASPSWAKPRDVLQMGRQADRGKVALDARGIRLRDHAELRGKFRRQHHADGNALAVEQAIGKAGRRFQRMAKGVAEIEQRALAGLALVARHDRRLGAAGGRDRVLARRTAGKDVGVIGFEPGEEGLVAEHAIFGDFGIAGAELARRQRVEHRACRQSPAPADETRRAGSCPAAN